MPTSPATKLAPKLEPDGLTSAAATTFQRSQKVLTAWLQRSKSGLPVRIQSFLTALPQLLQKRRVLGAAAVAVFLLLLALSRGGMNLSSESAAGLEVSTITHPHITI